MRISKRVLNLVGLALLAALMPQARAQQPRPSVPTSQKVKQATLDLHIFKSPGDVTVCSGDAVNLAVVAYPSSVTYVWRKDGLPLVPAQTGSTLTIAPASASDSGSYDVVVSLGSRSRTSAPASVTVSDGPIITVEPMPATRTVNPGITVVYSVTATGVGDLTYQWRKRPFAPFAPFVDVPGATSPTLVLENITANDGGSYKCVVTDECGTEVSKTVRLRIL